MKQPLDLGAGGHRRRGRKRSTGKPPSRHLVRNEQIWQPPTALTPYAHNAKKHPKRQMAQLRQSIAHYGFVVPIVVDEVGIILAGHARHQVALEMGLATVPTIVLTGLSEAEKRSYVLADNRIAENGSWDREILLDELKALEGFNIDLEITGFTTGEIDQMLEEVRDKAASQDDLIPPLAEKAICRPGDLWQLGRHHLLCADARDGASYRALLAGARAQMVFTDPPYNVRIDGHASGLGQTRHREFAMASGEMTKLQYGAFLGDVLRQMAEHSEAGSIHYICIDWRHVNDVIDAGARTYTELKNICVWAKDNGGMGSFYRSQHEMVCVFKNGRAPHINNFGLGQTGRYRTNLWTYPGLNSPHAGRQEALETHPTVKPVALVADAIRDCSRRDGIILDPFGGSGTTILAAERTHRRAYVLEIDPLYVDATIRRWQERSGQEALHLATGKTFAECEALPRAVRERIRPNGRDA